MDPGTRQQESCRRALADAHNRPRGTPDTDEAYAQGREGVWWRLQIQIVVLSLRRVRLCATPWTAARRASLSFTTSQSLLRLMSIESVMPSNHLILSWPRLFLPSVFPSIRVFSNGIKTPYRYKEWIFT